MTVNEDEAFAHLERLSRSTLTPTGPSATIADPAAFVPKGAWRWTATRARQELHKQITGAFLERGGNIDHDRRVVVVTAGPPAAGKSTVIDRMRLNGFRRIDPDDLKDDLLTSEPVKSYIARKCRELALPDGSALLPRELAGLVHQESIVLADQIRAERLAAGENIIIEGTLSWPGQPGALLSELVDHGYRDLEVIDVEVTLDEALARARARWWQGRVEGDPLGGRYVPEAVIRAMYPSGTPMSVSHANALSMFADAHVASFRTAGIDVMMDGRVDSAESRNGTLVPPQGKPGTSPGFSATRGRIWVQPHERAGRPVRGHFRRL